MDILFQTEPIVWIQQTLGPGLAGFFRVVSASGTAPGFLLASALAFWLFGRRALYALLALVAIEAVVREVISSGLGVERPRSEEIVKYERVTNSAAFPSGHMSSAAAVWTYLALSTRFPVTLSVLLILLAGIGRLYLGVHYVTDVVGGIVLGCLLAWGWLHLAPRAMARVPRWSFRGWMTLSVLALAGVVATGFFLMGDSHHQWNGAGLFAGVVLALPLEFRYVGYRPSASRSTRVRCFVAGLAGLVPLLTARFAMGEEPVVAGAVVVGLAALWTLLLAPALFVGLGWSGSGSGARREPVEATP